MIEDRIRTYCDLGGDQGHAADPIPNGIEFAETDAPFETEDYERVFNQSAVLFDKSDDKETFWLGGGPQEAPVYKVRPEAFV